MKLSHTREGFSELVGHDEDSGSEPPDFTAALSRLTDPTVAGSQAVLSAAMSYSSSQRVELAGKREAVVESELEEVVRVSAGVGRVGVGRAGVGRGRGGRAGVEGQGWGG